MNKLLTTMAALAALTTVSAGCAEPESPEPTAFPAKPTASTVFSPLGDDEPLPVDQVFMPDAHVEDGALFFRIQMLPGYYLYKDKIGVRSLTDAVALDSHEIIEEWSRGEVVVDEWFGEQEVFYTEAHGQARMLSQSKGTRSMEIELAYQGCKEDGICYMPQTKVLSVDLPARLESAADQTE